jgi:penicillin amidase
MPHLSGAPTNDHERAAVLRWLQGEPADEVAARHGITMDILASWRQAYFQSKLPNLPGERAEVVGAVRASVRIQRDTWGIAHLTAESEADLFFGLGYVMAQERLWQLDYQRRLVRGELAELFGRDYLPSDREMRTLGIARWGEQAWETASGDVRATLEALTAGINQGTATVGDKLPVEFEILDYQPRPWTPADSIALWKHRWWTLIGRIDLLLLNQVAQRRLPPDLLRAFQTVELADETIVPEGARGQGPGVRDGAGGGGALDEGSNNWVVAGSHTTTGGPVLGSDPHNVFHAPSQWVEAQVTCPSFDAAGAFYLGTPVLYLGRSRSCAWGVTNHMISVRDLYQEETSPTQPGRYRAGNAWQPFTIDRQSIRIAGQPDETLEIRHTVRGPVVNHLLPDVGEPLPPLSLRCVAAEVPSGFDASLGILRARDAGDVLAALRQWPCPPLNFVYADTEGHIGYHAAGWVPKRQNAGYALRQANEPADAWDGYWSFDDLPNVANPDRGWVATANNVPWTRSAWYLQSGGWSDGYRHRRIRERLTAKNQLTPEEIAAVHGDAYNIRARDLVPALLQVVEGIDHPLGQAAARALGAWNFESSVDSVGASIWATFWFGWCHSLARARFPAGLVDAAALKVGEVGRRLLLGESLGWFPSGEPEAEIRRAFATALDQLAAWGGTNVASWQWGKLHQVTQPHPMASLPGLARLFNSGPAPTSGGQTVRAASYGFTPPFDVTGGSTYRFVADLSQPDQLRSVQTIGQSGQLASPHYRDQFQLWVADDYHPFWMSETDVVAHMESETVISPEIG